MVRCQGMGSIGFRFTEGCLNDQHPHVPQFRSATFDHFLITLQSCDWSFVTLRPTGSIRRTWIPPAARELPQQFRLQVPSTSRFPTGLSRSISGKISVPVPPRKNPNATTSGVAIPADKTFDEKSNQSSPRIQIPVSGSSCPRFASISQRNRPPVALCLRLPWLRLIRAPDMQIILPFMLIKLVVERWRT